MNLRFLLFTVIASATLSYVGAGSIGHDKVQPFPQPAPVTVFEKSAVKFKPRLFIQGACQPYPAVNAAGETSAGLKGTGRKSGACKGSGLGSQVYGRAVWHKDLWAIMYAWYFPKDVYPGAFFMTGHRHHWISTVVWLDNPALAVSTSLPDGSYAIEKNTPSTCDGISCPPPFSEHINLSNPVLVYGVPESGGTSLGLTTWKIGDFQDLVMWDQLTETARSALNDTDFGEKAKVPFIDANFNANLETARPIL
ncbi:hypothetical protein PF005_g9115 [Phytophthora fragariae]|uniref:Necrosis inducing-like protein NPP1 type n=1 Tax=Phytophthora fragariae TaxID=53985 RepID=A0A6A3UBL1_9STRA|nr:hypothetical protein PF003_g6782 [Phytophthora fragariae]KAE8939445.1 hypothetical protein PF009_g10709 [Phytophthora fragariae]KAE9015962.1 hypothetical protein PF011_g7383 [Phytophthora fragariae]KAE9116227.1 hypothetical protein PF007_g9740 [Phytophthora fragariae]KAE9118119.1 hypothetical protein PF010_g8339 [Phytophthora fragariae]